jgi:polyisoprenoid-binding protein YceI
MNRLLLFTCLIIASCKTAPQADSSIVSDASQVSPVEGTTYRADISKSTIEWIGTKPTGRHHGSFRLKTGELIVGDNAVRGGSFTIDINSLTADDQKPSKNEMLQKHLLSDDFFDAVKFPLASFDITSITPSGQKAANSYNVTGNLRLKDIAKSISFPASISIDKSTLSATAIFNFDRTLWNMNYGNDKSLGNWFIRPDVNIKLHLIANRS